MNDPSEFGNRVIFSLALSSQKTYDPWVYQQGVDETGFSQECPGIQEVLKEFLNWAFSHWASCELLPLPLPSTPPAR